MSVLCQLVYKDGTETRKISDICFGFMYDLGSTSSMFDITRATLRQDVQYIKYIPYKEHHNKRPIIDEYLSALEEIGIRKVLTIPQKKLSYDNYTDGVLADIHTTSGQAFIGAFELIRNIKSHYNFVKLVVKLIRDGVSPDVALFIPRFFSIPDIVVPYADTTSQYVRGMKKGGEKLFSDARLKKNKDKYGPWLATGTFAGVYHYYAGDATIKVSGKVLSRLLGRVSYIADALSTDPEYKVPLYSQKDGAIKNFLARIYQQETCTYSNLLSMCNLYSKTGDLKEVV